MLPAYECSVRQIKTTNHLHTIFAMFSGIMQSNFTKDTMWKRNIRLLHQGWLIIAITKEKLMTNGGKYVLISDEQVNYGFDKCMRLMILF